MDDTALEQMAGHGAARIEAGLHALAEALEPNGVCVFEVDLQDDGYRAVAVEVQRIEAFVVSSRANGICVRPVVGTQSLVAAFEDMLRRYLVHDPGEEGAVRSAWPLDALTQQRCEAWFNGRVLSVRALSGFGSWAHAEAKEVDVDVHATDHALGLAVKACLDQSWDLSLRYLRAEIRPVDRKERQAQYQKWLEAFMGRHGYTSEGALLKNMLHCHLVSRGGTLTMSPSNHDRMDGWSGEGIPPDAEVRLPADQPPEQIGAALRLTFSRCVDSVGKARR